MHSTDYLPLRNDNTLFIPSSSMQPEFVDVTVSKSATRLDPNRNLVVSFKPNQVSAEVDQSSDRSENHSILCPSNLGKKGVGDNTRKSPSLKG